MRNIIVTLVSMFFILNVSAQNKGFDFLQKKMYDGGKSNYVMILHIAEIGEAHQKTLFRHISNV